MEKNVPTWFTITTQMVVLGLLDILDRFGSDHVAIDPTKHYEAVGCVYAVKNDSNALTPVCIVGQLLSDLGLLALTLSDPNGPDNGVMCAAPENEGNIYGLRPVLLERGVEIEDDAYSILETTQSEQDAARTWGYSVETAFQRFQEMNGDVYFLPKPPPLAMVERARQWVESGAPAPEPLADWEKELLNR